MLITGELNMQTRLMTYVCFLSILACGLLMPTGVALIFMGVANWVGMTDFNLVLDSELMAVGVGVFAIVLGPVCVFRLAGKCPNVADDEDDPFNFGV